MSQPALVEMISSSRYGLKSCFSNVPKFVSELPKGGP